MTCASCATKVSTVVSEVPGVIATGVDLDAGTLKVNGPDAEDSALRAAIAEATGTEVPESVSLVFVENKADATLVLPDYVDPNAELSEEDLEAVAYALNNRPRKILKWKTPRGGLREATTVPESTRCCIDQLNPPNSPRCDSPNGSRRSAPASRSPWTRMR